MKPTSKPSEESATGSSSEFRRAVIRLTAMYAAGILTILVVFSALIYVLFAQTVTRERLWSDTDIEDSDSIEGDLGEIREHLADILVISDAVIFFVALGLSYGLAKKTLAPLEEAASRQTRFVADAAHELRTPLAVLQTGAEVMLTRERTSVEYQSFLADVLGEVGRLNVLSNDLLFLAKDHQKNTSFTRVRLSDVCLRQIDVMKRYAESKKIVISESIDRDVFVLGKQDDLTRLVVNLLKNAIDYNRPGGSVLLSVKNIGSHVSLVCKDTGRGIAKHDLPHIFERFYKVDSNRAEYAYQGAGLGLAIVQEIVEAHGGTVEVESVVGKGTTFTVFI